MKCDFTHHVLYTLLTTPKQERLQASSNSYIWRQIINNFNYTHRQYSYTIDSRLIVEAATRVSTKPARVHSIFRWSCCMSAWCVLATMVATLRVDSSSSFTTGFVQTPYSTAISYNQDRDKFARAAARHPLQRHNTADRTDRTTQRQLMETAQQRGGGLWWRRHRKNFPPLSARLSPTDTSVPEVAVLSEAPTGDGLQGQQGGSHRSGLLLLATVPLVWGTYGPSVKYLYQMGDSTPGLVFNFGCYLVSVLTFALVALANKSKRRDGASVQVGLLVLLLRFFYI